MSVWMGRHADTGETAMLFLGCPREIKLAFLRMPNDYFRVNLRYPMLIHLYFLRRVAHNHWNTLKNGMHPLYEEVRDRICSLSFLPSFEGFPNASYYFTID